ncbi:hypothetical protein ScPMuIL_001811 [Solemya velum]
MAEGGGEDDGNPFSFKTFIQKKDPEQSKGEEKSPTHSKSSHAESKIIFSEHQGEEIKQTQTQPKAQKKPEDNPFSFKKFLAGKPNSQNEGKKPYKHKTNDLPDFVKDYFCDQPIERTNHPDFTLPDFALPSESGRSASFRSDPDKDNYSDELSPQPNILEPSFPQLPLSTDSIEAGGNSDVDEQVSLTEDQTKRYSILPDFLSGAFNNSSSIPLSRSPPDGISSHSIGSRDGVITFEVNGDLELEVRRLRKENHELQAELENAKKTAAEEARRASNIIKEMKALRRKDAEETEAMEEMIHQVETNLTVSTKRAVQAENTVLKLKQEVKSLQGQISKLQVEKNCLKSGDQGLAEIRERTQYAAEQLTSAATAAEQNLKQLLGGVDKMKLLGQVLLSIDKIQEEKPMSDKPDEEPQKHRQQESGS